MSVHVVSQLHISAILRFVVAHAGFDLKDKVIQELANADGEILLRENVRSVFHRYRDMDVKPAPFRLDLEAPTPSPVEVLKLIECLEYQSNASEDYFMTPAYRMLARIREKAVRALPGYNEAAWEL
ncbi:hypothetical protein ACU6C7_006158 [Pseudomonas aeruginosa]|nr:hypothetical protein [Pseudomonas aeruginosa]